MRCWFAGGQPGAGHQFRGIFFMEDQTNELTGKPVNERMRDRLGDAEGAESWMAQKVWQGHSRTTGSVQELDPSLRVHIRWMIRRDMPEVLAIEEGSFGCPWTEEDFLRCLRQRNCIGMVAEHGESIAGFMIYELHKNRLHILDFAVMPGYRRKSIGLQMITKLLAKLSSHRRTRVTLEVRETNLGAQIFFGKQGFRAVKVLRSYFEDSGEDAYQMHYQIEQPTALAGFAEKVED